MNTYCQKANVSPGSIVIRDIELTQGSSLACELNLSTDSIQVWKQISKNTVWNPYKQKFYACFQIKDNVAL